LNSEFNISDKGSPREVHSEDYWLWVIVQIHRGCRPHYKGWHALLRGPAGSRRKVRPGSRPLELRGQRRVFVAYIDAIILFW